MAGRRAVTRAEILLLNSIHGEAILGGLILKGRRDDAAVGTPAEKIILACVQTTFRILARIDVTQRAGLEDWQLNV